jgi:short-subunit dehydrogenase
MSVNVRSQFILTTRLLPLLLTRPQAFIAALTSDVATQPAPHRIPYACSKAASYALFSSLSAELQESPVSVIQLQPAGQVVTRGLRQRRPRDFDFSGYSSPQIFAEYFRSIVRARGRGMNGMSLVVS